MFALSIIRGLFSKRDPFSGVWLKQARILLKCVCAALKEGQFDATSACPLSEAASDQISQNKAVQSAERDDGEDELITDL